MLWPLTHPGPDFWPMKGVNLHLSLPVVRTPGLQVFYVICVRKMMTTLIHVWSKVTKCPKKTTCSEIVWSSCGGCTALDWKGPFRKLGRDVQRPLGGPRGGTETKPRSRDENKLPSSTIHILFFSWCQSHGPYILPSARRSFATERHIE